MQIQCRLSPAHDGDRQREIKRESERERETEKEREG